MTSSLKQDLRAILSPAVHLDANPALESVYLHLFTRELAKLGEEDSYFPTGGGANYSLLYLILRIACELRPKSVLDVGCGQTTLLWSRMRERGLVETIVSLENDPDWGRRIAAQVGHEVVVSPLAETIVAGSRVKTYDWSLLEYRRPFDVIVIDGPRGEPRRSRYGVLAMIDERLPEDFIVVLDDCERPGEQETVGAIHDRLAALGRPYSVGTVRAAKTQVIFCGGAYTACAYY